MNVGKSGEQLGFIFEDNLQVNSSSDVTEISLPDADIKYFPRLLSLNEANDLYLVLLSKTKWEQNDITYYGKTHLLPRLTAWYGDYGTSYVYSGIQNDPLPWTDYLMEIKLRVEKVAYTKFNCVLLNYYRSGADAVAWHQDNEPELGDSPLIASVSLGESRIFQLRHKFRRDLDKKNILLGNGSLLLMQGSTQQCWQHQIPKTKKEIGGRINLTFRYIHA
jgi:alkylated DNA repair dioxygenase AlkB